VRILTNILMLMMVAAMAAGVLWLKKSQERESEQVTRTRDAVHDLSREIKLKSATGQVELNGRGWPVTIDPAWFKGTPPRNLLIPTDRPWLEIASPLEADLTDPPVRQSVDRSVATFWYNPANGIVRARVGSSISDSAAVDMYNRINGTHLAELFDTSWDPEKVLQSLQEAAQAAAEVEQQKSGGPVIIVRHGQSPAVAQNPDQKQEPADPALVQHPNDPQQ